MTIANKYVWRAFDELETNAILMVDTKGFIRRINKGVTTLLGYSSGEIIGQKIELLLSPDMRELHRSLFLNYVRARREGKQRKSLIIGAHRVFPEKVTVRADKPRRFSAVGKNGQEIPATVTINEIWSDSHDLLGFVAILQDNSEQYNLQQELQYQSFHDKLTGLVNWQGFESIVQDEKGKVLDAGKEYYASVLYVDIDYFKTISYRSRYEGDAAIKKIATWLLNNTRQKKTRAKDVIVSRFISDEFIIYLPQTSLDGALTLAGRLKSGFPELNLRTKEQPFFTTLSIGIARVSQSTNLGTAVSQAANAGRVAKEKGKDRIKMAQEEDTHLLDMEPIIRDALKNNRLYLYAQKIIPISPEAQACDNNREHYEVLSRLEDDTGTSIPPFLFVEAAEKIGLAATLDMYVIKQTLSLLQNNHDHVANLSLCSINLSGISVSNEQMLRFIEDEIAKSGIDPGKLCFEVTETYEIQDNDVALNLVRKLRKVGCSFAFDDFGIGYSNYQSFSRFPVDFLKIDGSYVSRVLEDKHIRTDVEGMIKSAKSRGLKIVAEYVENEEIVKELKLLGVDYVQGYYFSKPMVLETLIADSLSSRNHVGRV
ncbi:MAG TPA: EAL domain-containing protein [Syntrophales bacterium]|nr:EAL domain-containing protein [Syntrophales bacterium]HPQ44131.1 EAL domain-containing protein [Syntrophales bacterium]